MNECWADPLGDCKGKISQEHTVTEGVLAETIAVEGFKWCKPEPKEIRREKLTRPILCEGHNNELSLDIDPAGVTFMDTFRAFWLLDQAREAMSSRRWTISVHGYRFAIFLDESGLAQNPYLPVFPEEGVLSRQHDAVYHIRELRFTVGGYMSHVVEFQW